MFNQGILEVLSIWALLPDTVQPYPDNDTTTTSKTIPIRVLRQPKNDVISIPRL